MDLKIKVTLFLITFLILINFVSAFDYPCPDGTTTDRCYDGTVSYPADSFGTTRTGNLACPVDNIIFKLSGNNNAHAALFSETSSVYSVNSCLSSDFGREYKMFKQSDLEDKDNVVLRLSGNGNAHAEKNTIATNGYINVTFGEQICGNTNPTTNECDGLDEVCVGAISGDTNAHVSDCANADLNGYNKICCRPACKIGVYLRTGDGKEIRDVFWNKNGQIADSTNLNNIVNLVIKGDGYCSGKEFNFGVYFYNAITNDELITLGNGEFNTGDIFSQSNPSGNLISCALGVCRARFDNNNNNIISLSLNLINEKFSKDKQYYFSFLINGANYYSNLLTVRETITSGCGNSIIESNEGEVCEPNILENRPSCKALGFDSGEDGDNTVVGCTNQCRFDTTRCSCNDANPACEPSGSCNDSPDKLNPGEECDDQSIVNSGVSCNIINNLWTGPLSCNSQCKFDISKCGGFCGNGIRESISYNQEGTPREPELCDTNDVPITCRDLGYSGGVLGCLGSCTFDTSSCVCDPSTTTCRSCDNPSGCGICGDRVLDSSNNEQCDSSIPSGLNCKSISTSWDGELSCNMDISKGPICNLNIDGCIGTCLNGRLDDNEVCDPTALSTPSNPNPRINECSQLGFKEGKYITCTSECELDTSKCSCPDSDEECKNTNGVCDGTTLDPGEECDDDSLTNNNLEKCSDIIASWKGDLSCNTDICKIDFSDCEAVERRECKKCSDCNTFFGNCGPDECSNFCGLDEGGCYFEDGFIGFTSECKSCDEIAECGDYTNEDDCNAHRDEGLPGGRCIGYALNNGQVADCKWDGSCKENQACVWECPPLNSIYGECQSDDFRYSISGQAKCTSSNPECGVSGVIYLPEKIKCGKYSEEKAFPVFDNLNLIFSILLLIGYYFVLKRKNEKI